MDLQKESLDTSKDSQNSDGYGSYNPSANASERKSEAELELERELLLNEYRNDREAILLAIKQAVKERNYKEAQEFIFKYRAAAKSDENFAVLARMTAQGLESDKKIEKIVTVLDATPDEDYETRIVLCERILKIVPDHEVYQKELDRCKNALHPQGTQIDKAHNDYIQQQKKRHFFLGLVVVITLFILFVFSLI